MTRQRSGKPRRSIGVSIRIVKQVSDRQEKPQVAKRQVLRLHKIDFVKNGKHRWRTNAESLHDENIFSTIVNILRAESSILPASTLSGHPIRNV
jgi:hypothetical protein